MRPAATWTVLALAGAAAAQDAAAVTAYRAGRLLPISAPPIDDGVMLVAGGKIVAIGEADAVTVPEAARVVDLGDHVVLPGFVDLHHHVSAIGSDINDMVLPVNPELRTLDVVRPSREEIRRTLAGGITTTLFIPGSGTNLSGFGVLLKMAGKTLDDMVIRDLGAMKVAQGYNPERYSGDLGMTRMGMHHLLTEVLLRGKRYAEAWRAWQRGDAPRPDPHPELEQLRKVFDLEVPVIVHTAGARDCIATARMFQDVFHVRTILSHGTFDGWWAAAALAERKMPVNLGPRTYQLTRYGRLQGIAAGYWQEGCTDMSINTDAPVIPGEQLPLQAAMAVRMGLPWQAALIGLTIQPARQIGIDDRVGSLEVGKDADFIVTAGDPLDPRYPPLQVYVEGELVHRAGDLR